jgi:hypothetical protein
MTPAEQRNAADGRRALFSVVTPEARGGTSSGEGRQALFSAPRRERGTLVVECDACQARTPVSVLRLGRWLWPSLCVPFRRFPQLMRCPACRRLTWCRLTPSGKRPAR